LVNKKNGQGENWTTENRATEKLGYGKRTTGKLRHRIKNNICVGLTVEKTATGNLGNGKLK